MASWGPLGPLHPSGGTLVCLHACMPPLFVPGRACLHASPVCACTCQRLEAVQAEGLRLKQLDACAPRDWRQLAGNSMQRVPAHRHMHWMRVYVFVGKCRCMGSWVYGLCTRSFA